MLSYNNGNRNPSPAPSVLHHRSANIHSVFHHVFQCSEFDLPEFAVCEPNLQVYIDVVVGEVVHILGPDHFLEDLLYSAFPLEMEEHEHPPPDYSGDHPLEEDGNEVVGDEATCDEPEHPNDGNGGEKDVHLAKALGSWVGHMHPRQQCNTAN